MPRGHPRVDNIGSGSGSLATSTTTAHAAVHQRRVNVLVRIDVAVSVPEVGLAGLDLPDVRAAALIRVVAAPGVVGGVQAAPWSSPPFCMETAESRPARWRKQRVASTVPRTASGRGRGNPPLSPANSRRRGKPLAAGSRRRQPGEVTPTWPSTARHGSGDGGDAALRGGVSGGVGGGHDNGLPEAGARPHTRAGTAVKRVRVRRGAACPAAGTRVTGVRLAAAVPRGPTPGVSGRGGRAADA